jgi:NAD(P)H-hydrate epimerase
MLITTAAEMRQLDQWTIEAGTPGWTLMRRAGEGAAKVLLESFPRLRRKRVVVVCGKGNNGGDGFVIAAALRKAGVVVETFLVGRASEVHGDAARALAGWRRARGRVVEIRGPEAIGLLQERLAGAACVVDALFGTGLQGEVRGLAADVIALLVACGVPVFAVDIPSGLDADRGVPLGMAVQAEVTATFALPKIGHVLHPGVEHCGRLAVVDIGIAEEALAAVDPKTILLDRAEVAPLAPRRGPTAHKGDCGHVLVIAGSRGKSGAAALCARGAARGGAGLVTVAVAASQQAVVAGSILEAMTEALPDEGGAPGFDADRLGEMVEGKSTVVCGPGLGTETGARAIVAWLLRGCALATVFDADALNALAAMVRPGRPLAADDRRLVLTPHPGEMARLAGTTTAAVQADRLGCARAFAAAHRCVVVLKGAGTVVAAPDGRAAVNTTGNPGMASGGMGDVLAGLTGALLAQGLGVFDAACLAVHIHGLAADLVTADRGEIGLLAGDVADTLPPAFRAIAEARGSRPRRGRGN